MCLAGRLGYSAVVRLIVKLHFLVTLPHFSPNWRLLFFPPSLLFKIFSLFYFQLGFSLSSPVSLSFFSSSSKVP